MMKTSDGMEWTDGEWEKQQMRARTSVTAGENWEEENGRRKCQVTARDPAVASSVYSSSGRNNFAPQQQNTIYMNMGPTVLAKYKEMRSIEGLQHASE